MENNTCEPECRHKRWVAHGQRRKRCAHCGKTRTMRKKRRGRKRRRVGTLPLARYLNGKSVRTPSRMLGRSRDLFLRTTPWPDVSGLSGPCILIADALHIRTRTYRLVVHVILIASAQDDRAWILPVHFGTKSESGESWAQAFECALSAEPRTRIEGLVCDGRQGLLGYARQQGWVVQRCQFHLIARLQSLRSVRALSRHRADGRTLHALAKTVFTTRSMDDCTCTVRLLERRAAIEPNRHLRTVVSGLVKHHQDYRTYLNRSDLCLPYTTNAVESVNSLIRRLMRDMRGFENETSARAWIEALLKHRRYIRLTRHRKSA